MGLTWKRSGLLGEPFIVIGRQGSAFGSNSSSMVCENCVRFEAMAGVLKTQNATKVVH